MSKTALFANRVENITVTVPLGRFDLATLGRPESGQAPSAVITHPVLMPLQGLPALRRLQDQLINKLVQDGGPRRKEAIASPVALSPSN